MNRLNKILSVVLVLCIVFALLPAMAQQATAADTTLLRGDINGDGSINAVDLKLLARYVAGIDEHLGGDWISPVSNLQLNKAYSYYEVFHDNSCNEDCVKRVALTFDGTEVSYSCNKYRPTQKANVETINYEGTKYYRYSSTENTYSYSALSDEIVINGTYHLKLRYDGVLVVFSETNGEFVKGREFSTNNNNVGDNVIRIGVFEPQTGDAGAGGRKEILGMQYANYETPTVTIDGTEYTIELVIADNGSNVNMAPSAASELVAKGVSLVLGSYGSGVSMAAGPIFDDAGLAAIGVSCTNPNVTAGNDYYFRICPLDTVQGITMANFAVDEFDAKVAYCMGEVGNDYDQMLIAAFAKAFKDAGGTVINDSFPTNNSDFTSYLNKAKSKGADVIFAPTSIAFATQIIPQASFLGIEAPILGSDTLDDNLVLKAAKGTNIMLFIPTCYQEGGVLAFDAGIKAYINGNADALSANGGNDTISTVTAMGYDAYYVALEAIKAAGSGDPAAIKTALPDVVYNGVSGRISFDSIGDCARNSMYIKKANTGSGKWEYYCTQRIN